MHPVSIPASPAATTKTIPVFEPVPLFLEFSVVAWSLFTNGLFISFFLFFLSFVHFFMSGEIRMTLFFRVLSVKTGFCAHTALHKSPLSPLHEEDICYAPFASRI